MEQVLASSVHVALPVLSGRAPKLINFLCHMGQRKDIAVLARDGAVRETGIVPRPGNQPNLDVSVRKLY